MKKHSQLSIIVDTREKLPLNSYIEEAGHLVTTDTLTTGDYSLDGFKDVVAIERKSLQDLIGSLTRGRARFERELSRAASFERFCVVVEAPLSHITNWFYRGNVHPNAILRTIKVFEWRYRCKFYFCKDREQTAAVIVKLLDSFMYDHMRGKRVIISDQKGNA